MKEPARIRQFTLNSQRVLPTVNYGSMSVPYSDS